jgi:hypothetical protein
MSTWHGAHLCAGWNIRPVLHSGQRGLLTSSRRLIRPGSYQLICVRSAQAGPSVPSASRHSHSPNTGHTPSRPIQTYSAATSAQHLSQRSVLTLLLHRASIARVF